MPSYWRICFKLGLQVEAFCKDNRVPGCMMAVRRKLIQEYDPFKYCCDAVLHDGALAFAAAERGSLRMVNTYLAEYRLHSGQQIGIKGNALKRCKHAMRNDVAEEYPLEVFVQHTDSEQTKRRLAFISHRNAIIHKVRNIGKVIISAKVYRQTYGNIWTNAMMFDILSIVLYAMQKVSRRIGG